MRCLLALTNSCSCSFADRGSIDSFFASKTTKGLFLSSNKRKSIRPPFAFSKFSPKSSNLTLLYNDMLALPLSESKNLQPASSSNLFILIRAFASKSFDINFGFFETCQILTNIEKKDRINDKTNKYKNFMLDLL